MLFDINVLLKNAISNFCDSTNCMKGKISGIESLLRTGISNLLNINGDTCHHAHNTVKQFLKPFQP